MITGKMYDDDKFIAKVSRNLLSDMQCLLDRFIIIKIIIITIFGTVNVNIKMNFYLNRYQKRKVYME